MIDWLKLATSLVVANQNALFQCSIAMQLYMLFMTLAPGQINEKIPEQFVEGKADLCKGY